MNTWQPIETAPLNQPVLVTDGKSVWFGQVKKDKHNAEDFPFFFGVSLQGDIFCQRPAFHFIEWQPAPDIFEKDFPEVAPDLIVAPGLALNNVKILPNKHGMAFAFDPKEPAEDAKVPTKTADEMFSKLGYKMVLKCEEEISYYKRTGTGNYKIQVHPITGRVRKSQYTHWDIFIGPDLLLFEEILACAQLIKEMRENE